MASRGETARGCLCFKKVGHGFSVFLGGVCNVLGGGRSAGRCLLSLSPQQRLGGHHHERFAAGAEQLAAEGMEVVGGRGGVLDEEVGVDEGGRAAAVVVVEGACP